MDIPRPGAGLRLKVSAWVHDWLVLPNPPPQKHTQVYIDAIQTLHLSACDELGLGEHTKRDIEGLLQDLRSMLEGVGMLRELTARCVWNY